MSSSGENSFIEDLNTNYIIDVKSGITLNSLNDSNEGVVEEESNIINNGFNKHTDLTMLSAITKQPNDSLMSIEQFESEDTNDHNDKQECISRSSKEINFDISNIPEPKRSLNNSNRSQEETELMEEETSTITNNNLIEHAEKLLKLFEKIYVNVDEFDESKIIEANKSNYKGKYPNHHIYYNENGKDYEI